MLDLCHKLILWSVNYDYSNTIAVQRCSDALTSLFDAFPLTST